MPRKYTDAEVLELGRKYLALREKDAMRGKAASKALTRLKNQYPDAYQRLYQEELAKVS